MGIKLTLIIIDQSLFYPVFFSKIYEKLVYNRLSQYVEKFCILNDCQFGFRSNRSTSMAVLEMTDKINKAMENNQFSIGVFVDLSKAF